jgi:hypothetical protein
MAEDFLGSPQCQLTDAGVVSEEDQSHFIQNPFKFVFHPHPNIPDYII